MSGAATRLRTGKAWLLFLAAVVAASLAFVGYLILARPLAPVTVVVSLPPPHPEASHGQVQQFCAHCHTYPTPDSFPRGFWRKEVKQGYDFFHASDLRLTVPSIESVALYYEKRAPEQLPPSVPTLPQGASLPVRLEPHGYPLPGRVPHPAIIGVNAVSLFHPEKQDVLICDSRLNRVYVLRPYEANSGIEPLAEVPAPARAEVVDLDKDGTKDILVACLGNFVPTDELSGQVVWLRGSGSGRFTPMVLLKDVGRVADVQAKDFNGDGNLDLVVAVFGWRTSGEILLLENQTTDWAQPKFVPRVLDDRHGTIHVPIGDVKGDGHDDIVALISQEHETVVAFLGDSKGNFRKETLFTAPHPAYGSSGIQLVDLDGNKKLDVLFTNGDSLDAALLKPYHGIQALMNRGKFPFDHVWLTPMYGVERAIAGDVDGDGDQDIVAVSYLPPDAIPEGTVAPESIILLEQVRPMEFVQHVVETGSCDHFTCALGNLFGDGKLHLVTGTYRMTNPGSPAASSAVTVWKNVGKN